MKPSLAIDIVHFNASVSEITYDTFHRGIFWSIAFAMFQNQLNRSSVDLKISVFTWKTLPAAVITVTQFAAKVFMLMKHATAKEKEISS